MDYITDPILSLRARALYGLYLHLGRVMSANELFESNLVSEGMHSIKGAMMELKKAGYITIERYQIGDGRWRTNLYFTDETLNAYVPNFATDGGNSTVGTDGRKSAILSIDSYKANSLSTTINTDTNVSVLITGVPPEEGKEMGWPGIDEEEPKKRKLHLDTDDDSGAVGRVIDKAAMRREKYKKTSFEAVPASMRRDTRDEDDWTTGDLVAEFYDLSRAAAPGVPSQINGKSLASWINKMVSEGSSRPAILKAIRMFFGDPRLIRDPGIGQPLWRRFLAFYPTVHGLVQVEKKSIYVDDDFLAHQEKMLKLLEG